MCPDAHESLLAGGPDLVEAGVVGPLGRILEQLSKGGGAKGVNIDQACATASHADQHH